MIKIKNNLIPPKGYSAVAIWPFLFYKGELDRVELNHERIHARQQIELLFVLFYLIWIVEYIFKGYDNISFEKEAYKNQNKNYYLSQRKLFAMWRKN